MTIEIPIPELTPETLTLFGVGAWYAIAAVFFRYAPSKWLDIEEKENLKMEGLKRAGMWVFSPLLAMLVFSVAGVAFVASRVFIPKKQREKERY